jgi:hypothetical protein
MDYFLSLKIPPQHEIWSWEKENYSMKPEKSALQFAKHVGAPLAIPADVYTLTGENPSLGRCWPEFDAYRDIAWWWKCVQKHSVLLMGGPFLRAQR